MDQLVNLLKSSMPFRVVSDSMLQDIAKICTRHQYKSGEQLYAIGDTAKDLYIVSSGQIEHTINGESGEVAKTNMLGAGGIFGWASLLENQNVRLAKAVCVEDSEVVLIDGRSLTRIFESDPAVGDIVMSRFATMIQKEFSVAESIAGQVKKFTSDDGAMSDQSIDSSNASLTAYRISSWLKSPRPYLMFIGFAIILLFWYLSVEVWKLPRFQDMPGITEVFSEWFSKDPYYGLSIYTPEYYKHIGISIRRIAFAFFLATGLGVPLGLFLGWSKTLREFIFPLFEVFRPIPVLAWVPLAIIIFSGSETPVIFLTFLASFFATTLNTMLGVESIDESYSRAAYCLGASRWQTFKHVVIPGAMPFIFTGLQISIGVAWFSLVAGEMVSGQYGLGYLINTSYMMIEYPKIIIGMITLGVIGYSTSALVRLAGDYMMQWRVRELALGDN